MLVASLFVATACGEEPVPVVGDPCRSIVDCAAGERLSCRGDTCAEVPCTRSLQCPAGAACVAGFCDAPECADDEGCSGGVCFEGDCRDDLCEGNASCEAGLICRGTPPRCVEPPGQCDNDLDCPTGTFCKLPQAVCSNLCDRESDCPGDSYCDGRFCREPCLGESECPGASLCIEGRCEEPADCGAISCPAGTPFLNSLTCECQSCLADGDCAFADGERCRGGVCTFCPVETELPSVCDDRGYILDGACCVACISDGDCTVGARRECERGACVEERSSECRGDADCPTGQECRQGTCRKSGSGQACFLQADCPDGEGCYGDGRCWQESDVCEACSPPARCVAEDSDVEGTCIGCRDACSTDSCPAGKVCSIVTGEVEGACIDANFTPLCP